VSQSTHCIFYGTMDISAPCSNTSWAKPIKSGTTAQLVKDVYNIKV